MHWTGQVTGFGTKNYGRPIICSRYGSLDIPVGDRKKVCRSSSEPISHEIADQVQYVSRVTQFVVPAQSSVVKLIEFWPRKESMPASRLAGSLKLRMAIESDNGIVRSPEREYVCGHLERGIFSWCYQKMITRVVPRQRLRLWIRLKRPYYGARSAGSC